MDGQAHITIPMEEYKELLIIKGRYEELKEKSTEQITTSAWTLNTKPSITYCKAECTD